MNFWYIWQIIKYTIPIRTTNVTPKLGNWMEEGFFTLGEYVIIHYCYVTFFLIFIVKICWRIEKHFSLRIPKHVIGCVLALQKESINL